jgi:hypothetical protein
MTHLRPSSVIGALGAVVDRQVIDEGMRLLRGQVAAVVVDEFVQFDAEAGQFERGGHGGEETTE